MKQANEVAQRYAKALFESIQGSEVARETLESLRFFSTALESQKTLLDILRAPHISANEKREITEKLLAELKLPTGVANVVLLLVERNRMDLFAEMVGAFQEQMDAANGVVRGRAVSSQEVSAEDRKAVEAKISTVTGKKVILEYQVDKSLIGGLRATVGSYTFDDTLDNQLRTLKETLKRSIH
ncbi:MAG: ATP synthase F1 subunit delta [Bdellovibrionales bacterium CG10_big_fil_rev_8_21_14_0_10_45_34]|nr:MAG: ATP synthase F1 subunit delta [Bdellovibrionales bacterium CG10_big_fil_rev_8_21_14_0_10_45_34]